MNTFGNLFRVTVFGESHGPAIGVVIDGCPPGLEITENDFIRDLSRRKSGAEGTTPRIETDIPQILSGVFRGISTGSPIALMTYNSNTKSADYNNLQDIPRPGHADFVSRMKFEGFSDQRGGGHFSGRLTWGLVAAGVIAKKIISPVKINAVLTEAGGSKDIDKAIKEAVAEKDSIGGIIECTASNIPVGLGEPFFWSVESAISQIVFSIPAIKGIEFGKGFECSKMKGSEHNDMIINKDGKTSTNNAGGINGGITNGNNVFFRIAVKPTSSIGKEQETYDFRNNKLTKLNIEGRHDSCIALRVPPVLEAAAAIALADLFHTNKGIFGKKIIK
jgi:chorismate synthase